MMNQGMIRTLAQAMMIKKVFNIIQIMRLISLFKTLRKVLFIKTILTKNKGFIHNLSFMLINQIKYLQNSSASKETFHWISLLEKITIKIIRKQEEMWL